MRGMRTWEDEEEGSKGVGGNSQIVVGGSSITNLSLYISEHILLFTRVSRISYVNFD